LPAKLPRIVVYLPEEVKADLERLAKSHYRPVSNMVLALIQEAVDRAKSEGRIPSDDRSQQNSDSDKEK
jgi:CopG-like RHH_1 or ribbon-helix-helix domain, RHH_5